MRREAAHAIIAAKRKWTENNGGIIMEFIRVSAALAAARGSADVLLLEREFILGGLGTSELNR